MWILLSTFLFLVTLRLRQFWKRLLSNREFERLTSDSRKPEEYVQRVEQQLLRWHLLILFMYFATATSVSFAVSQYWELFVRLAH